MKEYLTEYGAPVTLSYSNSAADGNIDVVFKNQYGDDVHSEDGIVPAGVGNYSITFPADLNTCDRELEVHIMYANVALENKLDKFYVRFRRPYLKFTELASELGLTVVLTPVASTEITQADLEKLERYAFNRINALTLNNFNKNFEQSRFSGTGHHHLNYYRPVADVSRVWVDGELAFDPTNDSYPYGLTFAGEETGFSVQYAGGEDVISSPYDEANFRRDTEYKIEYVSGWESVPEDIRQATALLANDFKCNDYGQRNHYVTRADTQFGKVEYSDAAFAGSGNVSVDQLLGPYVRQDFQVV